MGNLIDELSNITAIACDECGGAGFIFWGTENNYDVEPCDCVTEIEDELTLDWVNE
jgi:hypothetical protein